MGLSSTEAQSLAAEYETLLGQDLPEQRYQSFIEENSALVPREFLLNHGIHFDLVVRKMSLARDYTPDFFYMSKSSISWNLVLVEIEKPGSRYFKDFSNDPHPDFLKALDQVARWKAWMEVPANRSLLIDSTISPIHVPLVMRRNPCEVKYVLVHGRRSESEGNDTRRGLIRARQGQDFRIISYDSLAESLAAKSHLYVAARKNEHFDIVSTRYAGETLFSWVDPTFLRINDRLRQDILANRSSWRHHDVNGGLVFESVLPKLAKC
jgi:hypothetical protein